MKSGLAISVTNHTAGYAIAIFWLEHTLHCSHRPWR